jgi:hypothetical protein
MLRDYLQSTFGQTAEMKVGLNLYLNHVCISIQTGFLLSHFQYALLLAKHQLRMAWQAILDLEVMGFRNVYR